VRDDGSSRRVGERGEGRVQSGVMNHLVL
jgi:hypothetical protein